MFKKVVSISSLATPLHSSHEIIVMQKIFIIFTKVTSYEVNSQKIQLHHIHSNLNSILISHDTHIAFNDQTFCITTLCSLLMLPLNRIHHNILLSRPIYIRYLFFLVSSTSKYSSFCCTIVALHDSSFDISTNASCLTSMRILLF